VRFFEALEERLAARPEITETSIIMGLPLSDFNLWSSISRPDLPPPPPGEGRSTSMRVVDEDFFRMMGVSLVSGRPFTRADRYGAQPVAIVNRRLARELFGNDDPIGKQVTLGISVGYPEDEARTIVGVVEDLRTATLTGDVEPELYAPYAQGGSSFASVLIRSRGTAAAALAATRLEVSTLDSNLPIRDPGTMRQLVGVHTARPRFYLSLLALFAGLAITLAAVGLYGVVAYLVAQRSREIEVRLALGARAGHVVRLVVRQGFVPALVGAFFGLLAALAGARIMSSLLFGVAPTDPFTFAGTTAMLLAVAFLACLIPAARATRIPPASALRAER
jgi:putative ABC transport system permease protein